MQTKCKTKRVKAITADGKRDIFGFERLRFSSTASLGWSKILKILFVVYLKSPFQHLDLPGASAVENMAIETVSLATL